MNIGQVKIEARVLSTPNDSEEYSVTKSLDVVKAPGVRGFLIPAARLPKIGVHRNLLRG